MSNLSSFYPQPVIAGTTDGTFAEGNAPRIIDVTHAELLSLMGAQNLKRGFHYRITDFVTEYMSNDQEWVSPSNTANVSNNNGTAFTVASIAATPEPLIVYAFSSSEVSKQAYSELHPSDIIHYNPELIYLDGTHTAKGFIVYRRDPVKKLECPFDWRNVRFKRWAIDPTAGDNPIPLLQGSTAYKIGDLVYTTSPEAIFICIKDHTSESTPTTSGNFATIGLYSGNSRIFAQDYGILAFIGAGNSGDTGERGGGGQAAYYPIFSNFNGSLASSNFGNISVSPVGAAVLSNSSSYSLSIPNIVILNSSLGTNGHYNINILNSTRITMSGSGIKNQINISNSNGVHFGATANNISVLNTQNLHVGTLFLASSKFYNCFGVYVLGGNRVEVSYKHSSNITSINAFEFEINRCRNLVNSQNFATSYSNINFQFNGKSIKNFVKKGVSVTAPAHVFPATNNLPVISYVNENGQNVIEKIYDDGELLHVQLNNGILNAIDEIEDPAASLPIFSTIDNSTPTYTRNVSCWINDYVDEITCVSPWNSAYGNLFGCTAITPRHVLFARHVTTPLAGSTIRFITTDNQVVIKTILRTVTEAGSSSGNFDSGIALLDSDLPETIHKAKIIPFGLAEYLPYSLNTTIWYPSSGMFYVDQAKKAIIVDWRAYFGGVASGGAVNFIRPLSPATTELYNATNDSNKYEFYEPVVTNDSGGPVFSILNNELVLMGAITLGASPAPEEGAIAGVFYTKSDVYNTLISQVDAAEGISTGYTITLADISSFTKVN